MTSQGPAARLMDHHLSPLLFLPLFLPSPLPECVHAFPPGIPVYTEPSLVAHIIYLRKGGRNEGRDRGRREREREVKKKKKKKRRRRRRRRPLPLSRPQRAYCVILATVAGGVIIISKEGRQNTRPRIA